MADSIECDRLNKQLKKAISLLRSLPGETLRISNSMKLLRLQTILLASILEPDMTKHREYLVEAENSSLTVNPDVRGADLHTRNGDRVESKRIVHTGKRKITVNYPIPAHTPNIDAAARLAKILKSVERHTTNGYFLITIVDTKQRVLHTYRYSNEFLKGYFAKKILGAANRHDLGGCVRCRTCGHFHRTHHYHKLSERLEKLKYLSDDEWKSINTKIASQCSV